MAQVLTLVVLATAGYAAWSKFIAWERTDRRELVVAAVFAVLLADLLLYASQNDVPVGLFRLGLFGQSFRLPELVLLLALAARLVVHGGPKRSGPVGLALVAFCLWYAVSGIFGLFNGHDAKDVLYEAKAILYIGGGVALMTGVDLGRLVSPRAIGRWFVALGVLVLVMFPMTMKETYYPISLPGLQVTHLGEIGADASSVLVIIAIAALLVEGVRRQRRTLIGVAAVPMLFSVFSGTQRAAMLALASALVALVVFALGPTWRRRVRAHPTTIFLALAALAAVAAGVALVDVRQGERLPVASVYQDSFEATGKQQSADVRLLLWRQARGLYDERPLLGHGLGVPVEVRVPLTNRVIDSGFHNIGWDLVTRAGLVGLGLFAFAIGMCVREGLLAWRKHADARVAALAAAAVVGAASLLTKGMFEDVLDKHRLSILLGLLLGVMVTAGRTVRDGRDVDEDAASPEPVLRRGARPEVAAWS
jgi:O-antigen ligase